MSASMSTDHVLLEELVFSSRTAASRRIPPQAGRALEILGHAIEYLTDEFVESGSEVSAKNAQLEAVQMLMEFNRRIYFECPVAPTLGQRLRAVLGLQAS